jgi:hypothetical protein
VVVQLSVAQAFVLRQAMLSSGTSISWWRSRRCLSVLPALVLSLWGVGWEWNLEWVRGRCLAHCWVLRDQASGPFGGVGSWLSLQAIASSNRHSVVCQADSSGWVSGGGWCGGVLPVV